MKEVIMVFKPGGQVKILAEGIAGKGTAAFTESIAKELGQIEERHKGTEHLQNPEKRQVQQGQG
jgi:hypothetical protein